jgi:phenylalanyl-tRNA synthetase alpha chain
MNDDLLALKTETEAALAASRDLVSWDAVRVSVLGRNGRLTTLLKELGKSPPEQRRDRGAALNQLKQALTEAIEARRSELEMLALNRRLAVERIDPSLPPPIAATGLIHPISRTKEEIVAIFGAMGFEVAEGPDVESDWYNFGALNIPAHHPARQDQDTFYLPPRGNAAPPVLRTHTSPVQIRAMLERALPFRVIVPGRTYRSDHDATHSPMFHQCEGLALDRDITLGHLKGCLIDFLRAFFHIADLPVRFRSSYFPFTEPSMEVDIGWDRKSGELGKGDDWLEILGSGMVHSRVLANCGIDPREWQGFAFGMGIERVAMLKYGIPDLRPFFESDIRWLRHYGFNPLAPVMLHENAG